MPRIAGQHFALTTNSLNINGGLGRLLISALIPLVAVLGTGADLITLKAHATSVVTTSTTSTPPLNERVLVVYNSNDQESIDVANYYMSRRNIPATNKCAVSPSSTVGVSWTEFDTAIQTPVRNCLTSLGRDNILYVVFAYNTPYKLWDAPPSISVNYPAYSAIDGERQNQYWGQGGGWSDATPDAYPDWIEVDFSGSKTINQINIFTLQDDYSSPVEPTPNTTFSLYGIVDFDVQYWDGSSWVTVPNGSVVGNDKVWRTFTFSDITTSKIRTLVRKSLANYSRVTEIEAFQSGAPAALNVASAANGATAIASSVLQTAGEAGLSIDQRVADIWGQTAFGVNPYYADAQSKANVYAPFVSLADYRSSSSGLPVYSVWRLDAKDATLAKGLVDKAIAAEGGGLSGQGCFDRNRGDISTSQDSGYTAGDWDIYRAAEFARGRGFTVIEDANEAEFGIAPAPLRCDSAALYAGWYSYNNYNDAFSWNPGAIGFHLDSASAFDPRGGTNWSANAIQRGITVTAGSVSEPYLEGLSHVDGVFHDLFQGANVGDALLRNTYWLKWNIIYLGDPLYRPFQNPDLNPTPTPTPNPTPGSDVVWVEDVLPAGATSSGDAEGWNWIGVDPGPYSGTLSNQSNLVQGLHQHYFYGASGTLVVNTGDVLIAYVYLDPANLPSEVMLQWNDGTWEHRAYWGANQIGWGVDGTVSRRYMGQLPLAGQWVRLEVPAAELGLEGRTLNGMAFTLYGGRASWDHAGKSSNVNTPPPTPVPSPTPTPIPAPSPTPTPTPTPTPSPSPTPTPTPSPSPSPSPIPSPTPLPDFTISATPSSQIVRRGGQTTYTVTVTPIGGFTGTVTLGVSGLPNGASAQFYPPTLTGSGSSMMTVTTLSTAKLGTSTLTINGTSGGLQRTTSVSLSLKK